MPDHQFYVTTPIYYVNDVPHIGHAYTTIAADTLARFERQQGRRVFFLTGTDENSAKITRAAEGEGISPQALTDRVSQRFRDAWDALEITNDDFIRTTEARHHATVTKLWSILQARGHIYLDAYEGWYCTPCEQFYTEKDLDAGDTCPVHKTECEWLKEPSYFFRMSAFQEPLQQFYREHPDFIQPKHRRQEIFNRVDEGLQDLSVSRSSISWGVPVPDDPAHVVYVWFDALINYIAAIGYGDDVGEFADWWPADVHLVGKEILWFHSVIWPCMLMAADLPLPTTVFAHGWWTIEGEKMSKTAGNVIDPIALTEKYSADMVRYYLLREGTFGSDGDFSEQSMIHRINGELANDLGNLLSRTLALTVKNCGAVVPAPGPADALGADLRKTAEAALPAYREAMDALNFSGALDAAWAVVRRANRYVEETAPWTLKDDAQREQLQTVLYTLLESLRWISILLWAFMPDASQRMRVQLGLGEDMPVLTGLQWGQLPAGQPVAKGPALFPRLDAPVTS